MTAAIAGLGLTEVGKVYGRSATDLAAEAVRLAVADSGLDLSDVDGLLVTPGTQGAPKLSLQKVLGLRDLTLLAEISVLGASPAVMIAYAAAAVAAGEASTVACVFADAPLKPKGSGRDAFGSARSGNFKGPSGFAGYHAGIGMVTPNLFYALAAQRHFSAFGTTSEQLGSIAVAQRSWAALNPNAQHRDLISLGQHQDSPMIAEPLHLLDICLVSNGAAAVIVTSAERARDLAQPAVDILGWSQAHPGRIMERNSDFGIRTGAAVAGPAALRMAGLTTKDVDMLQLYDCYTFTVLVTLEDYGFCGKGEGGAFVADGALGPAGTLPCNTGGGQLSAFYLSGFTPVVEAVAQGRGTAGARQVSKRDVIMVSGNGGVLEHHATLILGGAQ
ncbi:MULTISPECIES: thiolase family protein [unclassified Mycobacterium]|uniref:thiolase family protein n=1 Tax=unclassified Mycobacterium TaxID=2642494 RepID=UPI0004920D50|nr:MULTISPECIES: thiolase family protein [unclassified Mycobacterium]SEA60046.1 Acetyl-CoA acetyltransferase [Mycobacterium sp. 283mftsu]